MRHFLLCVLMIEAAGTVVTAAPRPYGDFIRDVVELPRLAAPPVEGVTCRQFSSYDRASRIGKDGELVNWGANGDCGQFLRQDPEGAVLAEMDGPGRIARIWSANPAGTLKIYVDGAVQPTFQADFAALCRGEVPGIPLPIVGIHASGANCFLPMPYRKQCKVVVEKPKALYYHVNYWTYPAGTEVEPFHWPLTEPESQIVAEVADRLSRCGEPPYPAPGAKRERGRRDLKPGKAERLLRLGRGGAITAIRMKPGLPEEKDAARRALQALQLRITFDGEKRPQVLAPLGDFFGTAPGLSPYRSLPCGVTEEGCYAYWYMPFARSAEVEVANTGDAPVPLKWEIAHAPLTGLMPGFLHFHARWRREYPNKVFDWPFLEASGVGRFVGVSLSIWNPVRGWWGEGDEKVSVDGETFPSWFGTGSEDYFGYAWCSTQLFTHALHAQPLAEGPGNANYTSVNRWHLADNIPFRKSFRMTLENYGQDKDYASVAYWYQAPGGTDFFEAALPARELHEPRPVYKVAGALEGEELKILGKEIREVGPQDLSGFSGGEWSNGTHLWLRPAKVGEWIELALPVKEAGRYEVVVYLTKAVDYGIARFSLNGQAAGEPYDAFNDGVIPTGPVSLGAADLPAGQSVLRIEVTGKNEKSVGLMAGLDAVVLKRP